MAKFSKAKPITEARKKTKAFSTRTKNLRSAYGEAYRQGMHPRQTGASGGS